MKYTDLTKEEKKFLCNGAGRAGIQGILVPDWWGIFTEPSNEHDFDFWKGCTQKDMDDANDRYMNRLMLAATYDKNGKKRNILLMLFLRRMGLLYYNCVTIGGGSRSLGGFHYADKQRTHEDLVEQMKTGKG